MPAQNAQLDVVEQRLSQCAAQLDAANHELDSFAYSVSHDLRAPLRAIDGFSRILLEDFAAGLPDEGKLYLQRVRANTQHLGQLVNDLLAFSRLGRQKLVKRLVEPRVIVRDCLAEMTDQQEGRQVEIVIGDLPACHADSTLLAQVWTNLLSNALKFTRNSRPARIEIGCRTEPPTSGSEFGHAPSAASKEIYFVKDNGAGFDMKCAESLFGVFHRLHAAADYDGTGVGLAIVQRIVQLHGGRIWAEGKPNQGATFSFTLE